MILEICVDSVESAINAETGGADRLELCAALEIGGITPGPGLLESVIANVNIPVYSMIRPRGGDFLYSDAEFEVMRRDIDFAGETGAAGVVLGMLMADGSVDFERTAYLVEYASPMPVTFHRAFDRASDPFMALEDIISAGAVKLLTSGQCNSAGEGVNLLKKLIITAGERIIIMPGAGLNRENIERVIGSTGAREVHLTGSIMVESGMLFRRPGIGKKLSGNQEEKYFKQVTDSRMVEEIRSIINRL
ncbi:MAG: copper homeostasis protein CutC [Bacteroidales bacterium]|jgi:copper homeostasis protein|nr:copper homeostasis protein CutC [Bacteroidales bacterium]